MRCDGPDNSRAGAAHLAATVGKTDIPTNTELVVSRSVLWELWLVFLKLGLTSFGGPIAHLGYFRQEWVVRRRWMEDAAFSDLVALCQFLPGPASSQMVFALGMRRAGLIGGLVASVAFTLPSAALMVGFGSGVVAFGAVPGAGWLHGLKIVAVAVVAQAVWGMGRSLCPDGPRLAIAGMAALIASLVPVAFAQIGVIVAGGLAGAWLQRGQGKVSEAGVLPAAASDERGRRRALVCLVFFLVLLLGLPVLARVIGGRDIRVFDSFYRTGSLVFGGGHVVLPLLRAEVVPIGWLGDAPFLAGYAAAQALPGPLFTFAGYLGTVIHGPPHAWVGGVLGLVAIFLPAWLLIAGALPFWARLRTRSWAQAVLYGANAAVVGLLLAAWFDPVLPQGIRSPLDGVLALAAFGLLQGLKTPPWLVVLLGALVGTWLGRG